MENITTDEAYESLDGMVIGEEADQGGFEILPNGIYKFRITNIDKERYEPGPNSKLPPCWKVSVTLSCTNLENNATGNVFENLFCTKRSAWKIKNIFVAAGLVKREEKQFTPDWKALYGREGIAEISVRKYKDSSGNDREANDVKKYFDPEEGKKKYSDLMAHTSQTNAVMPTAAPINVVPQSAATPEPADRPPLFAYPEVR